MKPSTLLLKLIALLLTISIVQIFINFSDAFLYAFIGILILILLIDSFLLLRIPSPGMERLTNNVMALNQLSSITLTFSNTENYPVSIECYDGIADYFEADAMPHKTTLAPRESVSFNYEVLPVRRGDYIFEYCDIRIQSRLGLLFKQRRINVKTHIRVFPDYLPIIEYGLLQSDMRTSMMGIHKRQQRGEGLDFLELREYREGDSLRQIDWKSTSRLNKSISREYQVEQDQNFIFLLDCSHRMNSINNGLSHFDHILNAMLLTSYIALKQGDAVGYIAFGLESLRWSKPAKGMNHFSRLLADIYDIQPTTRAADYIHMAEMIPRLHSRTATLVLLTNLRDSDNTEITRAIQYLQKRYPIILASLRETEIEEIIVNTPDSFDRALTQTAAIHYSQRRKQILNTIQKQKIQLLDSLPEQLPVALANEYLKFKSR